MTPATLQAQRLDNFRRKKMTVIYNYEGAEFQAEITRTVPTLVAGFYMPRRLR